MKRDKKLDMPGHHIHAIVRLKNRLGGVLFVCDFNKNYKKRLVFEPVEGFLSELEVFELCDQFEMFFNKGVNLKAIEPKEDIVYKRSMDNSGCIKLYASDENTDVLIGYLPNNIGLNDDILADLVCCILNGSDKLEDMCIG